MGLTRDQLFIGLRLRDTLRQLGSQIMVVTELTPRGFRYTWAERQHYGARHGWSDGGESFELHFQYLELADKDQRPFILVKENVYG